MVKPQQYRARLRVRSAKSLTTKETELLVTIAGREVRITSQVKDESLGEAMWMVFNAHGFQSKEEASEFGNNLRAILDLVGFSNRIGIDTGEDKSTAWINERFAKSIGLITPEERLHPNIHGLAVVPDDGLSFFAGISANGKVTADPASFLRSLMELGSSGPVRLGEQVAAVRVMNRALLSQEPLAQIVLAISMIEAIGQDENWTPAQRQLLEDMAAKLEGQEGVGPEELEVAAALRRGMHRIGLRQGVMRVFRRLGLDHLRKEWDRIYSERSRLLHGTKLFADSEISELANAAIGMAGEVLIALLRAEGVAVPSEILRYYPSKS